MHVEFEVWHVGSMGRDIWGTVQRDSWGKHRL